MSRGLSKLLIAVMLVTSVLTVPSFAFAADNNEAAEVAGVEAVEDAGGAPGEEPIIGDVPKVEATLYSSKAVTVAWKTVEDAKGYAIYEVEEKDDETIYEAVKYTDDEDSNKAKISNVKRGAKHTYAVKAFTYEDNNSKEKIFSEEYKEDSIYMPKVISKKSKGYKNTTGAKVISLAEKKIGSKYVLGAQGPNKFDCSGFVWYVMKQANVTKDFSRNNASGLYRTHKKYDIGSKSLSKAQPGDMVFFSPGGSISHVAFYYGNNKLIHATNPRRGIVVTEAKYFGKIAGIVRLPNL